MVATKVLSPTWTDLSSTANVSSPEWYRPRVNRHIGLVCAGDVRPPSAHALGRDSWLYFSGQLISRVGGSFALFALPLLVFKLTHSPTSLAVMAAGRAHAPRPRCPSQPTPERYG